MRGRSLVLLVSGVESLQSIEISPTVLDRMWRGRNSVRLIKRINRNHHRLDLTVYQSVMDDGPERRRGFSFPLSLAAWRSLRPQWRHASCNHPCYSIQFTPNPSTLYNLFFPYWHSSSATICKSIPLRILPTNCTLTSLHQKVAIASKSTIISRSS